MAIIFPLFHQRLVRQVLQLEHSVAAIMTKMDIVTEKLELQESNRTNGKETMGKPSAAKNYVSMFGIQLSFLLGYSIRFSVSSMFGIQSGYLSCIFGNYSIKFARVDHLFTVHFPQNEKSASDGNVMVYLERGTRAEMAPWKSTITAGSAPYDRPGTGWTMANSHM